MNILDTAFLGLFIWFIVGWVVMMYKDAWTASPERELTWFGKAVTLPFRAAFFIFLLCARLVGRIIPPIFREPDGDGS